MLELSFLVYCFYPVFSLFWSIVRYLNPAAHHPARITKADKDFAKTLDFKYINFLVKIRDIRKIKKGNSIALAFLVMKIKKKSVFVSKQCCEEKHVDLLLIGERERRHCVLIKDFHGFMYDHSLHREKN